MNTSKIRDMLLGISIGDAFGAGVEFQDRLWIRENVDFTSFVNARDSIAVEEHKKEIFTKNYTPWDYTDDTEMTIGLIRALISKSEFSEDLLVEEWKKEYLRGMEEKGYGRNGHGSMRWYYSGENTMAEIRDFQRHRKNPGNAPAMRAVPLGLLPENLIDHYATINAQATHPNEAAIYSSQCIARASEYFFRGKGRQEDVIQYCRSKIDLNQEYLDYLTAVDALPPAEQKKEEDYEVLCGVQPIQTPYFLPGILGLPSDSKYTTGSVLYVLKHATNAFDALKMSIYFGGDVDSVASISTGIMAGRFGLASLPTFMIENVEEINQLDHLVRHFCALLNNLYGAMPSTSKTGYSPS